MFFNSTDKILSSLPYNSHTTGSVSQRVSYFTTVRVSADHFSLAPSSLRITIRNFFKLNPCNHCPYITSSLRSGYVCRLQWLLILASAVILGSESRWTHYHISLSGIRDSPNLEGEVPVFISPGNRVAQLYPSPGTGFRFRRLLRLAGLRLRYSTPPPLLQRRVYCRGTDHKKHRFQPFLYCVLIRCCGNLFAIVT
jgi:hypothetical protein